MRFIAVWLFAVLAATSHSAIDGTPVSPIDVRIPWHPIPFTSRDSSIYAYELRITNVSAQPVSITGVDVSGNRPDGPKILSLRGDDLRAAAVSTGKREPGDSTLRIASGKQVTIFVWAKTPAARDPLPGLYHMVFVSRLDSTRTTGDSVGPVVLLLDSRSPAVIDAPLRGGDWVARNGPSNVADHRRTIISVNGVSRIAQRFATDWLMLGPDRRLWHGDSTVNRNWYGYGAIVSAVDEGVVVGRRDGIAENQALSDKRAVAITLETVAGNYVIEKLGADRYALYAHLRPGSVAVRLGEKLTRGQTIGALGNSGNSGAPHLHFHLMDGGDSPLGAEGIPFEFQGFTDEGTLPGMDALFERTPWRPRLQHVRTRELPTENMVVRFR